MHRPLFPSNPPLKIEDLLSPPPSFWKFGRRFNPCAERKGEGCTLCVKEFIFSEVAGLQFLRVFIFTMQFQHTYFRELFYSWRSLFIWVANVFIDLPCLEVSATVRHFLPGWAGLKKRCRNDISRGNFGHPFDATCLIVVVWLM